MISLGYPLMCLTRKIFLPYGNNFVGMLSSRTFSHVSLCVRNSFWRRPSSLVFFSNSSGEQDSSSQHDSKKEQQKSTEKASDDQPPTKRSKLQTVLAGMRVESSAHVGQSAQKRAPDPRTAIRSAIEDSIIPDSVDKKQRVDPVLVDAVDKVADAFAPKFDPVQTRSELLKILLKHSETGKDASSRASGGLSHLLSAMKIDRTKKGPEPGVTFADSRVEQAFNMAQQPIRAMMEPFSDQPPGTAQSDRSARQRQDRRQTSAFSAPERIDLFGAEPLGVFQNVAELMSLKPKVTLKTWEELEQEELRKLQLLSPKNAFEEMALWTRQGKLWRYPINNEQDFTIEDDTDFSEHLFLDHLIEDFPRSGPIRDFMTQVTYALSCNPYITVKEKKDHVDWLRDYFKEKQKILVEVIGQEFCTFSEITPDSPKSTETTA